MKQDETVHCCIDSVHTPPPISWFPSAIPQSSQDSHSSRNYYFEFQPSLFNSFAGVSVSGRCRQTPPPLPPPPPIHRHKGRKNFRIRFINLEVIRVKPRNISTVVCDVSYVFVGVLLFIFKWIDLMGGRWRWGEGKVNWWVSVRLPSLDMSSNCREKWLLSKKCDVGGNRYCCWRITRVSLVELDGIYSRCILWMVTYFYGAIVSNRWSAACWLWRQCVAPELIPASIASKLLLSSPLETRSRWRGLHFVYIPFSLLFQLNCWFFSYCSPSSSCYSPRYYLFPSSANYRVRTCQKFDFYPHSRIS